MKSDRRWNIEGVGYLVVWLFVELVICGIGYLLNWLFGYLLNWLFVELVIWLSV
jgi:hypothetical protein